MNGLLRRYYRSEIWKEKKREVLEAGSYVCSLCGQRATQVHHLSYSNLGSESFDELLPVCRKCHAFLHDQEETEEKVE